MKFKDGAACTLTFRSRGSEEMEEGGPERLEKT